MTQLSLVQVDGDKVRAERLRRGWSTYALGNQIDMARNSIRRIERQGAAAAVYPETLAKLAGALKVEPASLCLDNRSTRAALTTHHSQLATAGGGQ